MTFVVGSLITAYAVGYAFGASVLGFKKLVEVSTQ